MAEALRKRVHVKPGDRAEFVNNARFCVGTGRMGLALQKEYQEQLALVTKLCGFQHIRGHGLFSDDMAIYQPYTDASGARREGYCFTYLDRVMDAYRALGLRPFLELGFMPGALASGEQTLFYWKANVTPPRDEAAWTALVKATLRHLAAHYGEAEVASWPCEVWNEPNLPGFWEHADEAKYLRLYEITSLAVREAVPGMCVGGPAVCGGPTSLQWIEHFLAFCRDKRLPLDFLTRHAYMGREPQRRGRYLYHEMRSADELLDEMRASRAVIDGFPEYRGLPMHITEFNTSYDPFCPIHDTNLNAAYAAALLSRLGDVAASYSYWTFGDVFEERGVPSRPFHGGFGMVANGLIPKPTLWAFAFFCNLRGEAVYRDEHLVLLRREDGGYEGVAWNLCREKRRPLALEICVPCAADEGRWALLVQTVDAGTDPLGAWHAMGEPDSLTPEQLAFLRQAGQPRAHAEALTARDGNVTASLALGENAVARFTLSPAPLAPDEGYDYGYYREHA